MNITLLGIFFEGILSFLSPCVLPLLPLYLSYLAGDNKYIDENGKVKYKTINVFITTLFFVLGICLTFVLIALSIEKIKGLIDKYNDIVTIICGTILFIFSLHEIGFIHIDILDKEKKVDLNVDYKKMNIFKAFIIGFVFSLGWSPCIGPMLSSAIALAATQVNGYLYILFYGLGLVIPFLFSGLFTTTVLNFVSDHKKIVSVVLKISGIIMLCFSFYMIYNASRNIVEIKQQVNNTNNEEKTETTNFIDMELRDQNGNTFKLSDYSDRYIIINFSTTWCTYCEQERPFFEQFSNEREDVRCFYVMSCGSSGVSEEQLLSHIKDNIHITTIIDDNDFLFNYFAVSSYPFKYIITPSEKIAYYPGSILDETGFNDLIEYCKTIE